MITGKAFNFERNQPGHGKYFGIRLRFDNPSVKKDPKYQEIRGKILADLANPENSKLEAFVRGQN